MQYDDVTGNPIWRTAAILKIVFGYISTSDYPINAKFCRIKQNRVLTQVIYDQNTKFRKFKMTDGRHFENSFSLYISQPKIIRFQRNLVCRCRCFQVGYLTKYQNFANSKWRTAAILKIVFWLYLNE